MYGDDELIKVHKSRGIQIAYIVLGCFGIILLRLWYLQIFQGDVYHRFSIQNRLRKEINRAPRGMIYSRNNILMVDNTPRLDAVLTRQFLLNKNETIERLSKILNIEVEEINKIINKYSFQAKYRPIIIKKNISFEEVAKIETENAFLPGVSVETFISRDYIDKNIGAHVLGYISEISQSQLPKYKNRDKYDYKLGDFIGQFGLEERMDKTLRGENGFDFVEVDALGRKRKYVNTDNIFKGIPDLGVEPGKNLQLTLDRDMQEVAYNALGEQSGSVVALDVSNGEVLTMISTPAFDPSRFSRGVSQEYWSSLINNEEKPMIDRSIQEHFPPGSTFKPFTAITALEKGLIESDSKIRCHGSFKLGRKTYYSWKRYGKEKVDVTDALKHSCNVFFYDIASRMDIDDLATYAKKFGFGNRTGVNLQREVSGLIPTKEWKLKSNGVPWQQGETLSCSIGQSYVLVSTLQLANAYAAIATRGKLYKPTLVKKIFDNDGKIIKESKPELLSEIQLKESTWDAVQAGLYKVANEPGGTAWWRRGYGNQMSGKTGTSQVIAAKSEQDLYSKCDEREYQYRHHGVFVAYAPAYDPKIAVAALVEHGCAGSRAAAPIVEKVINTYMKKYHPSEYEKNVEKEREQMNRYWAQVRAKKNAEAKKNNEQETEEEGD